MSGSNKRLVTFLYLLVRDDLPSGRVETLLRQAEEPGEPVFSNVHLAAWAKEMADRMKFQ